MYRVIRPTLGSTLATSLMLVLASMLFYYLTLDALRVSSQPGRPPTPPTHELMPPGAHWVGGFLKFLPVGAVWSMLVVVPALFIATRKSAMTARRRIVSYALVAAIAGTILVVHQMRAGNIPAHWTMGVVFALGAVIGVVGIGIADCLLQPNTSLERTRER